MGAHLCGICNSEPCECKERRRLAEKPKVVTIDGNPVNTDNKSPEGVMSVLDWLNKEIAKETHMAIGVVVVDANGRVGTHHFYAAGFSHQTISGAALLQLRLCNNYEKNLDVD